MPNLPAPRRPDGRTARPGGRRPARSQPERAPPRSAADLLMGAGSGGWGWWALLTAPAAGLTAWLGWPGLPLGALVSLGLLAAYVRLTHRGD